MKGNKRGCLKRPGESLDCEANLTLGEREKKGQQKRPRLLCCPKKVHQGLEPKLDNKGVLYLPGTRNSSA